MIFNIQNIESRLIAMIMHLIFQLINPITWYIRLQFFSSFLSSHSEVSQRRLLLDLLQFFLKFLNLSFFILWGLNIPCFIKSTCSAQWIRSLSWNVMLRIFQLIFTILSIFILARLNLWSLSFFIGLITVLNFLLLVHSFIILIFLLLSLIWFLIILSLIFTIILLNFRNILVSLTFLICWSRLAFYATFIWMHKFFSVCVNCSIAKFTSKIIRIYLFCLIWFLFFLFLLVT